MKYGWIDAQRGTYPLNVLCAALSVSVSGYRSWKHGGCARRARLSDAQMLELIRGVHTQFKGAYGSPRMFRELRARGVAVAKARVERLMRDNGIRACHKRRYRTTTDSKHAFAVANNLLERRFEALQPNEIWTADMTYIWTGEGFFVFGGGVGFVQSRGGGLVDQIHDVHANRHRCAENGVPAPSTGSRRNPSLGPGQPA